jgi:hypothetical protein
MQQWKFFKLGACAGDYHSKVREESSTALSAPDFPATQQKLKTKTKKLIK